MSEDSIFDQLVKLAEERGVIKKKEKLGEDRHGNAEKQV
jgi:hypothetical protein